MNKRAGHLVALVFDDPYDADEARAALHRMGGEGLLEIDETAVVVRHADHTVRLTQDVNVVGKSQHVGHIAGLLAAAVTGTMPFILAGTLGGRLLGRLQDDRITNKFLQNVSKEVQPGTSALILVARSHQERWGAVVNRLRQWQPRVLESDLPPEVEEELAAALQQEAVLAQ